MESGAFKKRAWVISILAITNEDFSAWTKNPYPYRVVQTATGFMFCDPDKQLQLSPIEDATPGRPLFNFKDPIQMKSGSMVNLNKDILTTIGNVFFNYCCVTNSFGNKIAFLEGQVSVSNIEGIIADRLEDNNSTNPNAILVSEYLKFTDTVNYLTNFTQLCVWAATEKSLTAPPGIKEFKEKLLEQYKDSLHDPATIAKIDAELVKFDAAYLKGDPSENFLTSGKSRNVVRKKRFLMHGAETGLSEKVGVTLIKNSLEEGWQIENFTAMNNSLRAGSFNRGAETQLGGESVKWLLRASSNITATIEDCGSTMGRTFKVTDQNVSKLLGFSVLVDGNPVMVNNIEDAGKYLGSAVLVRSPMYCKLDKTDYCLVCVGKRLAQNPTAISMAVSELGSAFLDLFMKKMHGTALLLAKMDYKTAIT